MRRIEMLGKTFGRLTVVSFGGTATGGQLKWLCDCSCGTKLKAIRAVRLRNGTTQSCGCLRSETTSITKTTHGKRHSAEYSIWCGILRRCTNTNEPAYQLYGAKGIGLCEEWRKFENFYKDMGDRPSPTHSIDRIDGNKGYSPENCRWATWTQQQRNRLNNVVVTYLGKTATLIEHCNTHNVVYKSALRRLKAGAPIDLVMSKARLPWGVLNKRDA
jgi:hypothetical protein